MGNYVNISPTKFIDLRTGAEYIGFRYWDDFVQGYNNALDSIPDDDMEFLELVLRDHTEEALDALMDFCEENKKGVIIGGNYYEWDKIKHIYYKVYEREDPDEVSSNTDEVSGPVGVGGGGSEQSGGSGGESNG